MSWGRWNEEGFKADTAPKAEDGIVSRAITYAKEKMPEDEIDVEEYDVYSDLIDIYFIQEGKSSYNQNIKLLVIEDQAFLDPRTKPGWNNSEVLVYDETLNGQKRIRLEESLIADFEAKKALGPGKLQDMFVLDVPVALINLDEFNGIPDGWDGFYKKFPNSQGHMSLSRVGFNSDRTKALVYMTNFCGNLCAVGCYFLLHKEYGDWIIRAEFDCWVS
jgi:hypothetical protein